MITTGRSALSALGLQDHQTVMIAHQDEAHPHLHLICNLVNPEHGKTHTLQYSRKRLSTWAEQYEREHSQKIYCEQRVENNQRRKEGERVRYQDPELDQKAILTKLYQKAENGQAFLASATEAGFTVAQGKRLVLLDREGKIHNLARQIEGGREKEMRAFLHGLELPLVDDARKRQEEERGKQALQPKTAESEKSEHRQPVQERDSQEDRRGEAGDSRSQTGAQAPAQGRPEGRQGAPDFAILNRMQNRQRDEVSQFLWEETAAARAQLDRDLERLYGEKTREAQREIDRLTQAAKEYGQSKHVTHLVESTMEMRLASLQYALAEAEARQQTARQALENTLQERAEALQMRHAQEREALQNGILPPKTELAQVYEQAAQAPSLPSPATVQERTAEDQGLHAFLDRMEGREGQTITLAQQSSPLASEFTTAAQERAAEDQGLTAFLDRMDGRRSQTLTLPQPLPPSNSLAAEFEMAAQSQTPEEDALGSFLDRMQEEQERVQALAQAPKVKDEYAPSLSAEFDAAGGEGRAEASEHAARDAFLDGMGGGMDHGVSLGPE